MPAILFRFLAVVAGGVQLDLRGPYASDATRDAALPAVLESHPRGSLGRSARLNADFDSAFWLDVYDDGSSSSEEIDLGVIHCDCGGTYPADETGEQTSPGGAHYHGDDSDEDTTIYDHAHDGGDGTDDPRSCDTNDCERPSCHRCFPRPGCADHAKCRDSAALSAT